MKKKIKIRKPEMKPIKAWALVENGKLCHYYHMHFTVFTKENAKAERSYYNEYLDHKMEIVPCTIILGGKK